MNALCAPHKLFVLPYLPNWLFEGPRTIKHRLSPVVRR
jgi:hypothetical protein